MGRNVVSAISPGSSSRGGGGGGGAGGVAGGGAGGGGAALAGAQAGAQAVGGGLTGMQAAVQQTGLHGHLQGTLAAWLPQAPVRVITLVAPAPVLAPLQITFL